VPCGFIVRMSKHLCDDIFPIAYQSADAGFYNQINGDISPFQDFQNPNISATSSPVPSKSQPDFNNLSIVVNLRNCEIGFEIFQLFLSWEC
jgi:hypothetical protein